MKQIPLTQGKFALVDDEDFERVNQYKWYANKSHCVWYARRGKWIKGELKIFHMHRFLTDFPGSGIDHIDGNGLNNQKVNLRLATFIQNRANADGHRNGSSQYKGVSWHKRAGKWCAQIAFKGRHLYIGTFKDEINAAKAYDKKAIQFHGKYARLNVGVAT